MIHTPLCDLLQIKHPIIQGGMMWAATAPLVAAVSEAGGLGVLGGGNAPPDYIREQIRQTRVLTQRPFGLNIALFSPYVNEVVELCIAEKVPVVMTGSGNPGDIVPRLKAAGIIVIPVVASVGLARRVARSGADAVVAEGTESGGHIGDVATLPLVPQVLDVVNIPVIAAVGFADGRGLAAALALGAAGIQMGTRFLCVTEAPVHPIYKEKILQANDRATITTGHSVGHPVRALRNPFTTRFRDLEKSGASEEEVLAFGTGALRRAVQEGDWEHGSFMAGQICGLIHDVAPAKVVIERIVAEAEMILKKLPGYVVA